jgi:hypothetical protein
MTSIYQEFCKRDRYQWKPLRDSIEETVDELLKNDTTAQRPGMLLGKVQSGKTGAFIGIIALAFDKGYDIAVILTKGTKALAAQTFQRLDREFESFIDDDVVRVYDIMNVPGELTPYIRKQKLIFIVKKETHNIERLFDLFEKYDDLQTKNLLIIDDEADYASIGFKKDKKQPDEISISTLAAKVDKIRGYGTKTDFLQVTATPYSLYLQPESIEINEEIFRPYKPIFTVLVPRYDEYIGSDFYFDESENPDSPAFYLHVDVPEKELEVLGKKDERYISNILSSPNLAVFRRSLVNFIVAGAIRRIQDAPKSYKCSCIIHTETARHKHGWQEALVQKFIEAFAEESRKESSLYTSLLEQSYSQFKESVNEDEMPIFKEVMKSVTESLVDGYIGVYKINSEADVTSMLDKNGQLRLDNPLNIFIGGQILDRGITVENLISFFYGRNPKRFQQDTVLQHSRMYGARSQRDIGVTRFYTSARIFDAMKRMHALDTALRKAFESGKFDKDSPIFLAKDKKGEIKHCSPHKILISSTETVRPYRRLLPRGMQTVSQTKMQPIAKQIDSILASYGYEEAKPFLISLDDISEVFRFIRESYEYEVRHNNEDYAWDVSAPISILKYLSVDHPNPNKKGKVYCVVKKNRNAARLKANLTFNDAPDDGQTDRPQAKEIAKDLPCVQLFHQNGLENNGWKGVQFWWPVLVCPENTHPLVFASDISLD